MRRAGWIIAFVASVVLVAGTVPATGQTGGEPTRPVAVETVFPKPTRPLIDVFFANVGEYPNGPKIECQDRDHAHLSTVDFQNLRLEVKGTVDPRSQQGEPSEHWDYLPEYWQPHPTRPGLSVRDETGHTFHANRPGNLTPIGFQLDQVNFWNLTGQDGVHGYTFKVVTDSSGQTFEGECFFTVVTPK